MHLLLSSFLGVFDRIDEMKKDSMYTGYCPDKVTESLTIQPSYCDCHTTSAAVCYDNIDNLGCSHLKKDKGKYWKKAKGKISYTVFVFVVCILILNM